MLKSQTDREAERPAMADGGLAETFETWWDALPDAEANHYEWDELNEPERHNIISDANTLFEAAEKAQRGSRWKASVQRFFWDELWRISKLQRALDALERGEPGAWRPTEGAEFITRERGRDRLICAPVIDDRVASHALNDQVIMPAILPKMIYDNSASIPRRGVSFSRRRLKAHLEKYARREGTDKGYILLKDQKKYYDNVQHEHAREALYRYTDNILARRMIDECLKAARVDASGMNETEYREAQSGFFDRMAWWKLHHARRGERWIEKGVSAGDQLSQSIGIAYPARVDSAARTVCGSRYYARYMDDSYDIDSDIERLRERARRVEDEARKIGMIANDRKTVICRTDKWFIWLNRKIRLKNGRMEEKLRPESVRKIRKRIRKIARKAGTAAAMDAARSWAGNAGKLMSEGQKMAFDKMIFELCKEGKQCTASL